MIIRGNAWVSILSGVLRKCLTATLLLALWLDIFSLVPFHDIINFSAVFRYGISRQLEFRKDTLTLESADEIL